MPFRRALARHRMLVLFTVLTVILVVVLLVIPHGQYCEATPDSKREYCSFHNALSVVLLYFFTLLSDFGAVVTGIATIAIAAFTATLWWTTRATLKHLSRQFEAEQRPWIPADIQLVSGWTWTQEREGRVTLRFILRNIGRTPAVNVDVRTHIYPMFGPSDPPGEQRRIYESERGGPIAPGKGMGVTLFPEQQPYLMDITMSIAPTQLEEMRAWFKETHNIERWDSVTPVIVGTITYRFVWNGEKHQTGFILELNQTKPEFPNSKFSIGTDANLPFENLRLSNFYIGSPIID